MSQKLPQICTASAEVYCKFILSQMQYIFAVTFGTLNNKLHLTKKVPNLKEFKKKCIALADLTDRPEKQTY